MFDGDRKIEFDHMRLVNGSIAYSIIVLYTNTYSVILLFNDEITYL